jgi:hypothetical protein
MLLAATADVPSTFSAVPARLKEFGWLVGGAGCRETTI